MFRWLQKYQTGIFLFVLLVDGMLFGATLAVINETGLRAETVSASEAKDRPGRLQVSDGAGNVAALTFDDGPHKEYTARLLDGLKERDVKVTFFLMGQNIEGNEDLVRRMQKEGHLIGNHSYRHIQLTKAGEEAVCEAVDQTEQIIEEITGIRPSISDRPMGTGTTVWSAGWI